MADKVKLSHMPEATKRTVVIFTRRYPYSDYTEVFLDAELPHASGNFDQIIFCVFGRERIDIRLSAISRLKGPVHVLSIPTLHSGKSKLKLATFLLLPGSVSDILREYWARTKRNGTVGNARMFIFRESAVGVLKLRGQAASLSKALRPLLAGGGPPVFYSYWFSGGAYLATMMARRFGGKSVSRAHAFDIYHDLYGYQNFHASTIRRIDAIFACSDDGRTYLQNDLPRERHKIRRSYLGSPDPGTLSIEGHQAASDCDALHIVSCANIGPPKRLENLVYALKLTRGYPIHWTHIGHGQEADVEALHGLISQELESRPEIQVEFLGFLPNQEVAQYYHRHRIDLLMSTSAAEGLPVSMMEAMSFGIPVAATAVGGVPEIVHNGYNGYLMSPEADPKEIATVLDTVAEGDQAQQTKLRQNARNTWETLFCSEINYPRFFEEIASL